ncbi:MAG: RsmG family class I SAM-dependent methyltransferase [Actinomycetota bacterium]
MTEPDWAALDAAWEPARAAGVLGRATIDEIRSHAAGFVPAACGVFDEGVDLGSGAGVPGLVLALLHPSTAWTLVDASERRTTLLERVVHAMRVGDRVTVIHGRVDDLAHEEDYRGRFDLATARLFGPGPETVECGLPLVNENGRLTVSVDEQRSRWGEADARADLAVTWRQERSGWFADVQPIGQPPTQWPRRPNARRRAPLF